MRLLLRRFPAVGGLLLFALLCAAALAGPKYFRGNGATLIVTTTNDSGPGSLRQALAAASDGDTIQFDPALNGQTINLTSGELAIDKNITITGPGSNLLTISRSAKAAHFRIFHILAGHIVTIQGLTISGGFDYGGAILNSDASLSIISSIIRDNVSPGSGGGIFNSASSANATLTILDSTIIGNRSSIFGGGGIYNQANEFVGTELILTNTVVSYNQALDPVSGSGYGGGIFSLSGSRVTLNNCTVSHNTAGAMGPPTPGGHGGGIAINGATLTITNSTISDNQSGGTGGGLENGSGSLVITNSSLIGNQAFGTSDNGPLGRGGGVFNSGWLTITNSTLSDNYAGVSGGGIFNAFGNGSETLTITNSTLSSNRADQSGGGITNYVALEIGDTILKTGTAGANIFNDGGTVTSLGYNLSSDNGAGFLTEPGDQINTDPMLGPLQDNGGPTFTHELLTGSPAINAGIPAFSPPPFTDQRGYPRVFNGRIDIGSLEVQPVPTPSPTPTATPCTGTIIWSENFDALPPGPIGGGCWAISTVEPDTPPNCAFAPNPPVISDCVLDFNGITIPSASAVLRFRNNFNTEYDPPPALVFWDGGVLEVSSPNISGGDWLDITDPPVGGSFVSGGYTGEINGNGYNPLAGRMAWSGDSAGYIDTVINLGPNLAGQTVTLRFRFGSDEAIGAPGWRIDTMTITNGSCASPTPTPGTPTPTATATATPTATTAPPATPTPTSTPSPVPARPFNLSTRMLVQTGDRVGIGGFIIAGSSPKQVLVRGVGPSLDVPNPLADPVMELHGPAGFTTITNDNWRDTQSAVIIATGLVPNSDLESAILMTLAPGNYTAIVRGKNNGVGVGLVELFDLSIATSQLANISTRAFVGTGDDVVIGGFILGGGGNTNLVVRGIGPSLTGIGIIGALADPTLELRDSNGALLTSNDNCSGSNLPPPDPLEACIDISLSSGAYTAILAGKNGGTGIGLVEIYNLN